MTNTVKPSGIARPIRTLVDPDDPLTFVLWLLLCGRPVVADPAVAAGSWNDLIDDHYPREFCNVIDVLILG